MRLFEFFFGCHHERMSFPFHQLKGRRVKAAEKTGTYVVCLDCGREFPYDWTQMAIVKDGNVIQKPLRPTPLDVVPGGKVRIR